MPGRVEGRVVAVTAEGHLRTDIAAEQLRDAPRDERTAIRSGEHETRCLLAPDHQEPPCTLAAVLSAAGVLELQIVGDSAALMLGLGVGEPVVVEW